MRRDRRISPRSSIAPWAALLALMLGAATAQAAIDLDDKRPRDAMAIPMANVGVIALGTPAIEMHCLDCDGAYARALRLWHGSSDRKEAGAILALLWQAAEYGHAPSQNLLGRFHEKGLLVLHDGAEAVRWYEKAAHQGLALAQFNAGLMHRAGKGVKRDPARAFFWLERAARQNLPEAQYLVAMMLEDGVGAERDVAAAMRWYTQAAEQGYAPAQHNLAVAYATGESGVRNDRAAVNWYRKAAVAGQPQSQLQLARALVEGQGVQRDEAAAYVWARVAAANSWRDQALLQAANALAARLARRLSPSQLEKAARDITAKLTRRS